MITIVPIVEGDGEVSALPVLLRRLAEWKTPDAHVRIAHPIRVHRDRFLEREDEFSRHIQLAAKKCGEEGWVLVLLDADDDCPATRGSEVLARARAHVPNRRISVVMANREYESWFIAAAKSLDGHRGFMSGAPENVDPEVRRDAKGWIRSRMAGGTYSETTDQSAFTAVLNLEMALEKSRSFRKLCEEWSRQSASF